MSPTAQAATDDTPTADRDLMSRERCDRCGAHAFVMVTVVADGMQLPLVFCGHHYAANEAQLDNQGAKIRVDIREQLIARETTVHA